jgi:hypothetical protein
MPFEKHQLAEEQMRSAVVLIRALLQVHPGLMDKHRSEFLRTALYKVSEAEGSHKYRTRYMSEKALAVAAKERRPGDSKELVHEHVYERAKIAALLVKDSDSIEIILKDAFACVVTKEEDRELRKIKKRDKCDGWKRYSRAEIRVVDTETDTLVDYDRLNETKP